MLSFIIGLTLIAVGAVMIGKPQLFFKLAESWKHDSNVDEPSKPYLLSIRLRGALCVLVGIGGVIVPLLT